MRLWIFGVCTSNVTLVVLFTLQNMPPARALPMTFTLFCVEILEKLFKSRKPGGEIFYRVILLCFFPRGEIYYLQLFVEFEQTETTGGSRFYGHSFVRPHQGK